MGAAPCNTHPPTPPAPFWGAARAGTGKSPALAESPAAFRWWRGRGVSLRAPTPIMLGGSFYFWTPLALLEGARSASKASWGGGRRHPIALPWHPLTLAHSPQFGWVLAPHPCLQPPALPLPPPAPPGPALCKIQPA